MSGGLVSVHLATTHRPSDPRIFQKECRTLAAAGVDVRYVVPCRADAEQDGVQILCVPPPRTGKERVTRTVRAVYRRAMAQPKRAVYHVHDADLLPAAFALKAAGRRVVYDMHEDVPRQMLHQHWIPAWARPFAARAYGLVEAVGARVFDGLIAAEPKIAERFPGRDVALVQNFPILDELLLDAATPYREREHRVAYVGSITAVRGLREVVQAVGALAARGPARLDLAGPFHPAAFQDELEQLPGWQHVDYRGWADRSDVAEMLGRARVGVVTLYPTQKYLDAYPTKLFEYMAAGLPVVCSDFPQLRPFVEGPGCGLLVDPQDPAAVADAIGWLLEHEAEAEAMGARGREAVEQRYRWASEAERLLAFYRRFDPA